MEKLEFLSLMPICENCFKPDGRQNVASFLTKDLKLDWRLGAEWFENLLVRVTEYAACQFRLQDIILLQVDYDVCSNYGNWNYSAGIGNDPREDRKFNMIKQGLDYDPEVSNSGSEISPWSIHLSFQGEYIRVWLPELANILTGKIHAPWTLRQNELGVVKLGVDYPSPMVIGQEWSRHLDKTVKYET